MIRFFPPAEWVARPVGQPAVSIPLKQSWSLRSVSFQPATASVSWTPRALHYDIVCHAPAPRNLAGRLNAATWELGDVVEIFLRRRGEPEYLEIHVTPENQRLQLAWLPGEIARLRSGSSAMAEFLIDDPRWVNSESLLAGGRWTIHVALPARCLQLSAFSCSQEFDTAVCRYDCEGDNGSQCSSTADLPELDFHHPEHWHRLILRPGI